MLQAKLPQDPSEQTISGFFHDQPFACLLIGTLIRYEYPDGQVKQLAKGVSGFCPTPTRTIVVNTIAIL